MECGTKGRRIGREGRMRTDCLLAPLFSASALLTLRPESVVVTSLTDAILLQIVAAYGEMDGLEQHE